MNFNGWGGKRQMPDYSWGRHWKRTDKSGSLVWSRTGRRRLTTHKCCHTLTDTLNSRG